MSLLYKQAVSGVTTMLGPPAPAPENNPCGPCPLQNVLRHLGPWGRTQAALAIKPWCRLGTLPARKLVLVGSQFDASPQCLAQLAAAAPQAQELQLYLDAATAEGTVPAIFE